MPSQANPPDKQANTPLPEGTQLENYRILRVIAVGGFSIVYLAHDEKETPVVIKEYLPATLALRANGRPCRSSRKRISALPRRQESLFGGARCHLPPNVVRVLNSSAPTKRLPGDAL